MIEFEQKTIRCMFNRSVELFANEPSFSFVNEKPLSHLELGQQVKQVSEELKQNGISKGDRVAILGENSRSKNMILGPSGENIYPEEIEAKLNESEYVLESLVYEKDKRIVARVHLDYETLDKKFKVEKLSGSQIHQRVEQLLIDIKKEVNANVSDFSRINVIIEQQEPFEKTPTQKIKRYLYTE